VNVEGTEGVVEEMVLKVVKVENLVKDNNLENVMLDGPLEVEKPVKTIPMEVINFDVSSHSLVMESKRGKVCASAKETAIENVPNSDEPMLRYSKSDTNILASSSEKLDEKTGSTGSSNNLHGFNTNDKVGKDLKESGVKRAFESFDVLVDISKKNAGSGVVLSETAVTSTVEQGETFFCQHQIKKKAKISESEMDSNTNGAIMVGSEEVIVLSRKNLPTEGLVVENTSGDESYSVGDEKGNVNSKLPMKPSPVLCNPIEKKVAKSDKSGISNAGNEAKAENAQTRELCDKPTSNVSASLEGVVFSMERKEMVYVESTSDEKCEESNNTNLSKIAVVQSESIAKPPVKVEHDPAVKVEEAARIKGGGLILGNENKSAPLDTGGLDAIASALTSTSPMAVGGRIHSSNDDKNGDEESDSDCGDYIRSNSESNSRASLSSLQEAPLEGDAMSIKKKRGRPRKYPRPPGEKKSEPEPKPKPKPKPKLKPKPKQNKVAAPKENESEDAKDGSPTPKKPKKRRRTASDFSPLPSGTHRRSTRVQHKKAVEDEMGNFLIPSIATAGSSIKSVPISSETTGHVSQVLAGTSGMEQEVLKKERAAQMAELEKILTEPFEKEIHWQICGRKRFPPPGSLSPNIARYLGRNAGMKKGPFLHYTDKHEVARPSVRHAWRTDMLECRTIEDLYLQMRILEAHVNRPTINSCETLARRSNSTKSLVQKVVKCSHRDPMTGQLEYLVVNRGKSRGCWLSEETVDLSALILKKSECVEENKRKYGERLQEKQRRKDEELRKKVEAEAKRRAEVEAEAKRKLEEKRKAEQDRRRAEMERRKAEALKRKAEAEAKRKLKAENDARKKAEREAKEAKRKAEIEARRRAEMEARWKAEAVKREMEAQAKKAAAEKAAIEAAADMYRRKMNNDFAFPITNTDSSKPIKRTGKGSRGGKGGRGRGKGSRGGKCGRGGGKGGRGRGFEMKSPDNLDEAGMGSLQGISEGLAPVAHKAALGRAKASRNNPKPTSLEQRYTDAFEQAFQKHQLDTKMLLKEASDLGLTTVPNDKMNAIRLKNMDALRMANDSLHSLGSKFYTSEEVVTKKLSDAESLGVEMHIKAETEQQDKSSSVEEYEKKFKDAFYQHQLDTKRLLKEAADAGLETVPPEKMNTVRNGNLDAMRTANNSLRRLGSKSFIEEEEITQKLSEAEGLGVQMHIKAQTDRWDNTTNQSSNYQDTQEDIYHEIEPERQPRTQRTVKASHGGRSTASKAKKRQTKDLQNVQQDHYGTQEMGQSISQHQSLMGASEPGSLSQSAAQFDLSLLSSLSPEMQQSVLSQLAQQRQDPPSQPKRAQHVTDQYGSNSTYSSINQATPSVRQEQDSGQSGYYPGMFSQEEQDPASLFGSSSAHLQSRVADDRSRAEAIQRGRTKHSQQAKDYIQSQQLLNMADQSQFAMSNAGNLQGNYLQGQRHLADGSFRISSQPESFLQHQSQAHSHLLQAQQQKSQSMQMSRAQTLLSQHGQESTSIAGQQQGFDFGMDSDFSRLAGYNSSQQQQQQAFSLAQNSNLQSLNQQQGIQRQSPGDSLDYETYRRLFPGDGGTDTNPNLW